MELHVDPQHPRHRCRPQPESHPESPQVPLQLDDPQLDPHVDDPQLDPHVLPQLEQLDADSQPQGVAAGCSQWPRSTHWVRVSETGTHSTICRVACRVSVCGTITVYCSCCSFCTGTDTVYVRWTSR
jgi:hypothetical protein